MHIQTEAVGPFFKNGFLVSCEQTREGVLIDPGDEVDALLAQVERRDLQIRYILLTHAHVDHITGVPRAKRVLGAPIGLHRGDLFLYERAAEQAVAFGLTVETLPEVDVYYEPDQVLRFGEYAVRPHHTPGHCPGGVCLEIGRTGGKGQDLFVGDTLFAGSIGRTDLPGGDYTTLMRSIRDVLLPFGDAARIYPGHGPDTTIGRERLTNPFLQSQ